MLRSSGGAWTLLSVLLLPVACTRTKPTIVTANRVLVQAEASLDRPALIAALPAGARVVRDQPLPDRKRLLEIGGLLDVPRTVDALQAKGFAAGPDHPLAADLTPDDFPMAWGLGAIGAPAAWEMTTGSARVVLGIVDSGIDYRHPDLYLNIWLNEGEIPASIRAHLRDTDGDGVLTFRDLNDPVNIGPDRARDCDGDGRITCADVRFPFPDCGFADGVDTDRDPFALVDDLCGWNFEAGTSDPRDDNGHGTYVAGIIGAIGNNRVEGVGVNWTVLLAPLRVLGADGRGTASRAALATEYAAWHRFTATNNSYGGDRADALAPAIVHASDAGLVFVASAGNGRGDDRHYPAAFTADHDKPNVLSVAASDSSDARPKFSAFGPTWIDVAAPGAGIRGPLPGGRYEMRSGTSAAAAHVTGVVGLLKAYQPALGMRELVDTLLAGTRRVSGWEGLVGSRGIASASGALALLAETPLHAGSYAGRDDQTRGNWKHRYGSEGYRLAQDADSLPSYARVQLQDYDEDAWSDSTADRGALQKGGNPNDRLAARWYGPQFTIDVNLTDGRQHRLSVYLLDEEEGRRAERIELFDGGGRLLDRRDVRDFAGGAFLTWYVAGRTRFRITRIDGSDATVSAIFLDPADVLAPAPLPPPVAAEAKFLRLDTATRGDWRGRYGLDGYQIGGLPARLPGYARLSLRGAQTSLISMATSDIRAPRKPSGEGRWAAAWSESEPFELRIELGDREMHRLAMYIVDFSSEIAAESVEALDGATGRVLDRRTVVAVAAGQYLIYDARGTVRFRFRGAGTPAVVSAVFFGVTEDLPPIRPASRVAYLGADWDGAHGTDRLPIEDGALHFGDGDTHRLAFEVAPDSDADPGETIEFLDRASMQVMDHRAIPPLSGRKYLLYEIQGDVEVRFSRPSIFKGVFRARDGEMPVEQPSGARFIRADPKTGGAWHGRYGAAGYVIAGDENRVPAFATIGLGPSGYFAWDIKSGEKRALQRVGNPTRVGACHFDPNRLFVDLRFRDGEVHTVGFYAVDFDSYRRAMRVEVLDANTGHLLDGREVSGFAQGVYLFYRLTGNVRVLLTRIDGANAVLSGVFFED